MGDDCTNDVIEYYLTSEIKITASSIGPNLMLAARRAMIHDGTNLPKIDTLVEVLLDTLCDCVRHIPRFLLSMIIRHIIVDFHESPKCRQIQCIEEYWNLEHAMPTKEALVQMIMRRIEIEADPDEYCESKRMMVPTPNLDKLQATTNTLDRSCSICQEPLDIGQPMYRLPCGDCFHATNCIGDERSILTWLKKCKRCPNCNMETIL